MIEDVIKKGDINKKNSLGLLKIKSIAATKLKEIRVYPQIPIIEKGYSVYELNDQIDDKGIHGNPQNIFPLIQSKKDNIRIIYIPALILKKSLRKILIKKYDKP